jgi:hypothetical protein
MPSDSGITFQGPGPFALPVVQSASATALGENVEMTLRVSVDGRIELVYTQMIERVASELATQLIAASTQARANSKKS